MKKKYLAKRTWRKLAGAGFIGMSALSISCSLPAEKNYNSLIRRTSAETRETNINSSASSNTNTDNNSSAVKTKSTNPESLKSFQDNLPAGFAFPTDFVGRRILSEYGALYVADGGEPPSTVMFSSESECSGWQSKMTTSRAEIGGFTLELQSAAMKALQAAVAEAESVGESITPRGADSAKRSYAQTVELWASRVNPALTHWVGKGKISPQEAERLKALSPSEQVAEVLRLEEQGIFFSKDLSKSILYSVAAPGTSQHLSMLALDVEQFANPKVREILAHHGWFQTVQSDLPHFTYLGLKESELPSKGLKAVFFSGQKFWIPNLKANNDKG